MKKTQFLPQLLLVLAILGTLLLVPLLTFLEPDYSYSVQENRALAERPTLSAASLWDGSYFSDWESYFSDHVAGRSAWLKLYTALELLRGKASVNGVVLADGVLLPSNEGWGSMDRDFAAEAQTMAESLKPLCEQVQRYGGSFLYVGVPEQRSVYRNAYPASVDSCSDYLDAIEQSFSSAMQQAEVPLLLLREVYQEAEDLQQLYSTVDHHYTLKGAYTAYLAICDALTAEGWEIPVVTEDAIRFRALDNAFLGTYNRKLYGLSPVSGTAYVYETALQVPFTRTDNGESMPASVMNLPENGEQSVSYNLYMGGDVAETVIDTGRDELPSILIVGDSFTNALESIAYLSFNELRSLDFRYYTEMSLSEYIARYQPDIVLVLRDDTSYLYREGNGALQ